MVLLANIFSLSSFLKMLLNSGDLLYFFMFSTDLASLIFNDFMIMHALFCCSLEYLNKEF